MIITDFRTIAMLAHKETPFFSQQCIIICIENLIYTLNIHFLSTLVQSLCEDQVVNSQQHCLSNQVLSSVVHVLILIDVGGLTLQC